MSMSFGRRTVATSDSPRVQGRAAVAVAGGMPASRNGRSMVAFTPGRGNVRTGGAPVQTGACGDVGSGPNPSQPFCSSMAGAGPIPAGAGKITVPKRVGAVNGTATYQITVSDPCTIEDLIMSDPSGQILTTSVNGGRNAEFLESGAILLNTFNANGTHCKLAKGFNIWPSKPLNVVLVNDTLSDVQVAIQATVWPMQCPQ